MHHHDAILNDPPATELFCDPVRAWFATEFPRGALPAQTAAWPLIKQGRNVLIVSPTGSGKTLAAFLAILDGLFREYAAGTLTTGLRAVYVSPLRSLNYDIERNLRVPLEGIHRVMGPTPLRIGVRTGDTSAHERRKLRDHPPHLLITTPESLSLLLGQTPWLAHWKSVRHLVIDEVHALAPTKRGADLAVSLERLSAHADADPARVGLSATCQAGDDAPRFLVGSSRECQVVAARAAADEKPPVITVESLIERDEAAHRGLANRRLLHRLGELMARYRTTVVFTNTRAMTEKVVLDLRMEALSRGEPEPAVAAHHSALDATRRRRIEHALKLGELALVATSTSLELGVDIGTVDMTAQLGLPGGVSRWLQRLGRSGRRRGARSRGIILAATAAELAGAIVTAQAAREGQVEPTRMVHAPLDVVCQQLIGMACAGEQSSEQAFQLIRKAGPMSALERADFESCLAFLAGDLTGPASAYQPEPGATPRMTAPRLWRRNGWFGVRTSRVVRWFRGNVGTIHAEPSVRVMTGGTVLGSLEAGYAERLSRGDRFVLDGRAFEVSRTESGAVHARPTHHEAALPRWTSDRPTLSPELARALAAFRDHAGRLLIEHGPVTLRDWITSRYAIPARTAMILVDLFEAQARYSEIPAADQLLVEISPKPLDDGLVIAFHAPLHRGACEALGRATAARFGRRFGRNLALSIADLGWSIQIPTPAELDTASIQSLLAVENLETDVLEGLDQGELLAKRFQRVAATAMMVLKNPEPGRRVRVGGLDWVATRLYPMLKAGCPDHPLLKEARREVLEDLLDVPAALGWLESCPTIRVRRLEGRSPFTAAWIEPQPDEPLAFEAPMDALKRLHERLTAGGASPR